MSLQIDPPFSLGQTLGVNSASDGGNWVGVVKLFPDVNPITGRIRSNRVKRCVAVRNTSGSTLFGKRAMEFASGSQTEVVGYKRSTALPFAGVSDEFLPSAGVAANDVFWVTVEGPTELTVGETVAVDNFVHCGFTAHTTNGVSSAGTGGRALTANQTIAGTLPIGSVIGRVLSGTTGDVTVLVG